MAPRFLLRAVKKAATKAAKSKAAKASAAKLKKAASSSKASTARITSQNKVAKTKKLAEIKAKDAAKKAELAKNAKHRTAADKAAAKLTPKQREVQSTGIKKPKKSAPASIKTSPAKRTSTIKSKSTVSETARRRANRRSTKISNVGKSKTAAIRKQSTASTSKDSYTPRKAPLTASEKRKQSRSRIKTTRTKTLTAAEKARNRSNNLNDQGAGYVRANTPKSTRKTVQQASGPASLESDLKNSTDPARNQRAGIISNKKGPQPKSTNAPQKRAGRVERNARTDSRRAVEDFEVKARKTISARVKRAADKGMTGTQQRDLKRKLERQMNAGKRKVKAAAERKSSSSQSSNKNNTNPSVSSQKGVAGRDWRNRLSNSKVKGLSEAQTKANSGTKVRTNRQALQAPRRNPKSTTESNKANFLRHFND